MHPAVSPSLTFCHEFLCVCVCACVCVCTHVTVLTVSARRLLCFEMGVFLFCFRSSSDIPTKMPVPQEVICLDDRELEHLTLQQPKQREKCDDTKTDMYGF